MNRQYFFIDKWGYSWNLAEPVVMGYLDHPMIDLGGTGRFQISPDAFEELAKEYLKAHGYVVVSEGAITGDAWYGRIQDTLTTLQQRLGDLEEGMERLGPIIGHRKRGSDE